MSRPGDTAVGLFILVGALLVVPPAAGAQPQPSQRPTSEELAQPAAGEWLTNGGSLSNSRYLTLDEINTSNVANLRGVWLVRLSSARGTQYRLEADPVVVDGVMYLSTGNDDIFAVEARTAKKL